MRTRVQCWPQDTDDLSVIQTGRTLTVSPSGTTYSLSRRNEGLWVVTHPCWNIDRFSLVQVTYSCVENSQATTLVTSRGHYFKAVLLDFPHTLLWCSLSSQWNGCVINVPCGGEHPTVTYSLLSELSFSVTTSVYCKKFRWWGSRATLFCWYLERYLESNSILYQLTK